MPIALDTLRRRAKVLRRAYEAGDPEARRRILNYPPRPAGEPLKHADFLHVIAREESFESWPKLKFAAEAIGLDRAQKQQRLEVALAYGQAWMVDRLLADAPDLADGAFGLQVALLDRSAVEKMLLTEPALATAQFGPRRPMLHLAFSRRIHARPDLASDMLAIAEMLVANGASVNDSCPVAPDNDHPLSALYGAIGHADNMILARWLLERGADPNDNESLYHSTELGHHEGLRLLLAHGANPKGTNALLRAMDFNDHDAVQMLIAHGAHPDDFEGAHLGGERPWVIPALHQAARRMSDAGMIEILLAGGADPARTFEGCTAYGYARVFGNGDLSRAIESRGAPPALTEAEALLAAAADGADPAGRRIVPATLPEAYRNIIRTILHLPGKLDHVKRLVALGVEHDRPDAEGLTPIQVAGWEGLPEMMAYLLSLGPDLNHVNGYGGGLLSTIVHGSENCPQRAQRDHVACLELALVAGVALPRRQIELAGEPFVAAFLADWAEAHPRQVVEGA